MHHFSYRHGILHAENVDLTAIANEVGTPYYCYSSATLRRHYRVFSEAFSDVDHLICYAVKANSNQAVLTTLAQAGAGADVVSEGELRRALAAGISANKIVFSGVGKTSDEIRFALDAGILCFNVESIAELRELSRIAQLYGKDAPVSLRINPDVDSGGHGKITTGRATDKFGISWEEAVKAYDIARDLAAISICGIDMHIGSQITELAPFERAFARLSELVGRLRRTGHHIDHVDLGGGLGIPYHPDSEAPPLPRAYSDCVRRHVATLGCRVLFEPGRLIAGNAGILVTRLLYVKQTHQKQFYIVDAGMNDLIRPTLYDAYHDIIPVRENVEQAPQAKVDIVGPVCESGDFFARDRPMPPLGSGELLAVMSAGAYGAVQASSYNSRLLIPEVLVNDSDYAIVRPRPSYEALIAQDQMPHWLR